VFPRFGRIRRFYRKLFSFQEASRKLRASTCGDTPAGFQDISNSRSCGTIRSQLRPVVEHKGIGGHAPAVARAHVRIFKRLEWQTKSRVRPTFVCHGNGGWSRFRKISENTQNVSESFSSELHRVPAQFEVSEYFRMFQKVSIGHPAAPPNGSENPVVEHKEIAGHDARVSRVSTSR
jgi:hypothetical protein